MVTQDVIVVGTSFTDSAIYHTVQVANLGSQTVNIGWRNLYDWDVTDPGNNRDDGPSNQPEASCGTGLKPATIAELTHPPITAQKVPISHAHPLPTPPPPTYHPVPALTFARRFRPD